MKSEPAPPPSLEGVVSPLLLLLLVAVLVRDTCGGSIPSCELSAVPLALLQEVQARLDRMRRSEAPAGAAERELQAECDALRKLINCNVCHQRQVSARQVAKAGKQAEAME